MVIAIRGETTTDGKWTTAAEADDVRKLIEKGAANTHRDRAGGTPLHECCLMGLVEHAKVLLSNFWLILKMPKRKSGSLLHIKMLKSEPLFLFGIFIGP